MNKKTIERFLLKAEENLAKLEEVDQELRNEHHAYSYGYEKGKIAAYENGLDAIKAEETLFFATSLKEDRDTVESICNASEILTQISPENLLGVFTPSFFMDLCNDEDILYLAGLWIGTAKNDLPDSEINYRREAYRGMGKK